MGALYSGYIGGRRKGRSVRGKHRANRDDFAPPPLTFSLLHGGEGPVNCASNVDWHLADHTHRLKIAVLMQSAGAELQVAHKICHPRQKKELIFTLVLSLKDFYEGGGGGG
jgi:hypothetical protein